VIRGKWYAFVTEWRADMWTGFLCSVPFLLHEVGVILNIPGSGHGNCANFEGYICDVYSGW
jgi:hypothetical protein